MVYTSDENGCTELPLFKFSLSGVCKNFKCRVVKTGRNRQSFAFRAQDCLPRTSMYGDCCVVDKILTDSGTREIHIGDSVIHFLSYVQANQLEYC